MVAEDIIVFLPETGGGFVDGAVRFDETCGA
jgi:hypothetical protein